MELDELEALPELDGTDEVYVTGDEPKMLPSGRVLCNCAGMTIRIARNYKLLSKPLTRGDTALFIDRAGLEWALVETDHGWCKARL